MEAEDFSKIFEFMDLISIPANITLNKAGENPRYCYFIESGVVNVSIPGVDDKKSQIGMVGREGMTPSIWRSSPLLQPFEITMQIAGTVNRIPSRILLSLQKDRRGVASALAEYTYEFATQIAYTAYANANFRVEQRVGRWLLMCHERADMHALPLTHEHLAEALSVRRPSITTALHILEGEKLITTERGQITVVDRQKLSKYGAPEMNI